MKYHLYDEQERHQGKFDSVYDLRKFLSKSLRENVNIEKLPQI